MIHILSHIYQGREDLGLRRLISFFLPFLRHCMLRYSACNAAPNATKWQSEAKGKIYSTRLGIEPNRTYCVYRQTGRLVFKDKI